MDEIYTSLNLIKETIKSSNNLQAIKDSLASASSLLLSSSSSSPLLDNNNLWEQAYGQFTTFLLDYVFVDWVSCFTSYEKETLFDNFFIHSPSHIASFLALTSYAFSPTEKYKDKLENGYVLEYIENLFTVYFIQKEFISRLILEGINLECERNKNNNSNKINKLDPRWDRIITLIGSLPERFGNILEGKTSEYLLPEYH